MPVQNYDSVHKLIVPPVSFADVNSVLGTSYTKLSQLCQASKIRRWAKYKPVAKNVIDTTDQLDSSNKWASNSNWWRGTGNNCGITLTKYTSLSSLCNAVLNGGWENAWAYSRPTGTTSAPFRLSDFNYYCHALYESYDAPFNTFFFGNVANTIFLSTNDNYISETGKCYRNQYTNPYLLDITSVWSAGNVTIGRMYFGVAICRMDSPNPRITLVTSEDNWDANVQYYGTMIRETQRLFRQVFQYRDSTYMAVPLLSTDSFAPATLNDIDCTDMTGTFYVIPLEPVELTLQTITKSVRFDLSISGTPRKSGTGITFSLTVTATKIATSGSFEWSGGQEKVQVSVFQGGQSPPTGPFEFTIPSHTAFSSTWPKTYTFSNLNYTGTTGIDYVQTNIAPVSQEWIAQGHGADFHV